MIKNKIMVTSDNNNSNDIGDAPFKDINSIEQKGRIYYGGFKMHVIHQVIEDETNNVYKVNAASVRDALEKQAVKHKQMATSGYDGPYSLPHHCFGVNQKVTFVLDNNNEAQIINLHQ
jgi:hypothetical protein